MCPETEDTKASRLAAVSVCTFGNKKQRMRDAMAEQTDGATGMQANRQSLRFYRLKALQVYTQVYR